ncbi:RNase HI [Ligilactobacillus pobuzihii]|uniref:ribonuclease H family protein n=1 Tax=Ligilactobacillus pobuzihii TaxID=449659 RepID=UPI0019CFBCBF|nr:ribonuclease H family protein [Ligilactobacillus pobuzihii]MBN7274709.1 RNase HI [Ligilactobacillus pobuzihii]
MELKVISTKFYAVAKGKKTGIFTSWPECQRQVSGYAGAKYKSFKTQAEALQWLQDGGKTSPKKTQAPKKEVAKINPHAIKLWTDGGSRNHGNKKGQHVKQDDRAAWAFCAVKDGKKYTATNGEYGSTNNKMEIMALLKALKFIGRQGWQNEQIVATLDSKYVLDAITKHWITGWKKRGWKTASQTPVANKELWQEISKLLPYFTHLEFQWTKGHAKNAGNILVDQLLNDTMDKM